MVPDRNEPKWKEIVRGEDKREYKTVAAGLCVARNQRAYRMDPTPVTLNKCVDELVAFFTRYEKLAAEDVKALFGQEGLC
ncbi:MAG: hypothetical protein JW874_09280 [Spirochaetales bacterium]|nr:hypothetical protein [Spirochaetales bacterium]